MSFISLPLDIQQYIVSDISKADILSLNLTCKGLRQAVKPYVCSIFEKHNGALAEMERDASMVVLDDRIKKFLDLPEKLGAKNLFLELLEKCYKLTYQERIGLIISAPMSKTLREKFLSRIDGIVGQISKSPFSVHFNKDGIPELKKREVLPGNPSFWSKYRLYESLYCDQYACDRVFRNKFSFITPFLRDRPLKSENLVQNFINRNKRSKNLQKELSILHLIALSKRQDFAQFKKNLNFFEKIIFQVVILVRRIFSFIYYLCTERSLKNYTFGISLDRNSLLVECASNWYAVSKVRDISARYKDKIVPYQIKIRDSFLDKGVIEFAFTKNTKSKGSINIKRVWKDAHGDDYTENSLGVAGPLTDRRLQVEFFSEPKQDPSSGDFPLHRTLTHLAVEIFRRETEKKLEIIIYHSEVIPVLIAGGFKSEDDITEIRNEIEKARTHGKLFPSKPSISTTRVFLTKSDLSTPTVNFKLNSPPTSWEQIIKDEPLLEGNKPILPKYIIRDLSPYEV